LFARVQNFSDSTEHAVLSISVDGQSLEDRNVDLGANSESDQIFDQLPAGARYASVTLSTAGGQTAVGNGLSLDDSAFAVAVNLPDLTQGDGGRRDGASCGRGTGEQAGHRDSSRTSAVYGMSTSLTRETVVRAAT
jgi:hypothetical protein